MMRAAFRWPKRPRRPPAVAGDGGAMLETPAEPAHAPPLRGRRRQQGGGFELPRDSIGRALFGILRRRKLPLIACALLIPALAVVALKRVTPLYTATGTLIYDPNNFKPAELQSILQVDPTTEAVMASQAEVLRGLRLLEPVAHQLNLFANPAVQPGAAPAILADPPAALAAGLARRPSRRRSCRPDRRPSHPRTPCCRPCSGRSRCAR